MSILTKSLMGRLACAPLCWLLGCWLLADVAPAADRARFAAGDITRPEFFPILPWDPYHGWRAPFIEKRPCGLESVADCHFNLAPFVRPDDLKRCQKLGLAAVLYPTEGLATNTAYTKEWRKLAPDEIERRVRRMIQRGGSSPAVAGYFIMDEPGVQDFPALGLAVAAVKRYAPGKMAYINLYPNYATIGAPDRSQLGVDSYTEYLERFVAEVKPQFLSYDNYRVETSMDLQNAKQAASYYHNLLEVRRVAQRHGLPYLQIVAANQIRPYATPPSPANLAFQAYTTLAAGCRGVTWFTYYQNRYPYAAVDTEGRKTLAWYALREINRQVSTLAPVMARLTSTGLHFSAPAPVEGLPLLPGELVAEVSCPAPLMLGEFRHADGSRYVMAVNLSLERSAKFVPTLQTPWTQASQISAADGSRQPADLKNGLWLTAGQGILLLLSP